MRIEDYCKSDIETLSEDELKEKVIKFQTYCRQTRLTCRNACSMYDTIDRDCYIFGENKNSYSKCEIAFIRWLRNEEEKPAL